MIKAHSIAATLAITSLLAWSGPPGGLHELQAGQKFEIIGELHAHAVRDDFTSSAVAVVTLVPLRLSGPEIISRQQVPYGSVMTVLGRAPKRFLAFLYADRIYKPLF